MREKTVFFGNGMNRVDGTNESWAEVLKAISRDAKLDNSELLNELLSENKYTMAYETMAVNGSFNENEIKGLLIKKLRETTPSSAYQKLSDIDASHYITTNYEHHLNDIVEKELKIKNNYKKLVNEDEDIYSIRRCHTFQLEDGLKRTIWNIHGSTLKTKSLMLGYDHYCGYIGKIGGYIKGTYSFDIENETQKIIAIEEKLVNQKLYDNISWLELFFNSNIHITGFGLTYDESDIWWILNKRARMKKDPRYSNLISNQILYYSSEKDLDVTRRHLLEAFGVKVVIYKKMEPKDVLLQSLEDINNNIYLDKY